MVTWATFGGAASAAVIDAAVEDNTGSDASAERGVKNVSVTDSGAPDGFGEGGGVAVVVDARGETEDALDFGSERKIAPAGDVGRIENDTGFWDREGPGRRCRCR